MKHLAIFIVILAALSGCASNDFGRQLDTYRVVESARATEGAAKYTSLQVIATGASDSTKQVALQAWQAVAMVEQFGTSKRGDSMPVAPPSAIDRGLQALSILAPIAGNVWTASYAKNVATNASNNAAAVAINEASARTAQLGVVKDASIGVASAVGGGYASAFQSFAARPTTQITVNGDGNTTGGRDATTNKNDCPQTADASGGNSGASGNGGAGAPGGNVSAPGTGGNGATGGQSGPTGAGAPGATTQATNCVAGK